MFLLIFFVMRVCASEPLVIRYVPPENPDYDSHMYYVNMLRLALERTTESHGSFQLKPLDYYMVQERAIYELTRGRKLDIYWTMTSNVREAQMLPIRIPLIKGLLGFRIFIIREEDQEKFTQVKSIADLNRLQAGQGTDWPDTTILRANDIQTIGITDYDSLFPMLEKKRIDYIPRGINEPWNEIETHKEKGFVVEKNLMLQYRAPIYFFVHQSQKALAQRIETGLRLAINDGTFDQLFYGYPGRSEVFERANVKGRKVFQLVNPLLTPQTPLDEAELWLDPYLSEDKEEQ